MLKLFLKIQLWRHEVYMISQENSSGKPLADSTWLENHHRAKISERLAFAKKLATFNPKKIVDLGCATGLWFGLLDQVLPNDCEFIGIDSDANALDIAIKRSNFWKRKSSFIQLNLEEEASKIPAGDITLAFNIFPYINDLDSFINMLSSRTPRGYLAIRQYDGASIRFGPMPTAERQSIEASLRIATENSQKFHHYDMDRTFSTLHKSAYKHCEYNFELFERVSPFSEDFIPYYKEMLLWTCQHLSDSSAQYLRNWLNAESSLTERYFYEVDLVAILS